MRLFLKRLGCLALLFSFLLALPISMEAADQKATKDRIKATFIGSAVVVTYQPSGWTEQEAEQYIRKLQKLREDEELSQAGVPPTTPTSRRGLYAAGTVFLIDRELPRQALLQFAQSKDPGYLAIAPHIKGYYQWSILGDDEGVIGFRTQGYTGGGREYNHYRRLFLNRHKK